jgi:hypothetical protein
MAFEVWIQGTCLLFLCSIDFPVIHRNPLMLLIVDAGIGELLYPVSDFFVDMSENDPFSMSSEFGNISRNKTARIL